MSTVLAAVAERFSGENKSAATCATAQIAAKHYLEAAAPTPKDIIANTSKAYRRAHPTGATTTDVPCIHDLLDKVMALAARDDAKAKRNHFMLLLVLLTGRRASSIVRVWDHPTTLTVSVARLDAPSWAKAHRTEAAEMLARLGRLPRAKLADNEFVVIRLRAHLSKTCQASGQRFDPWMRLTENRFVPQLCPARSLARHLDSIKGVKITQELRCDPTTVTSSIKDGRGGDFRASPLLVSLNGRPRGGLQASTLNSRVRDMLLPGVAAQPHITRATVASHRKAHGESVAAVLALGAWRSEEAFKKHHFRLAQPPTSPLRLRDVSLHDWRLARAHQFYRMSSLPPLPGQAPVEHHTENDAAIAIEAMALNKASKTRRLRRRAK